MDIGKNVVSFYKELEIFCSEVQINPEKVIVIGASKKQNLESIQSAYSSGLKHFGENFLQEAEPKIRALGLAPCWHFIGSIQSKKAKKISSLFEWVHTVDRIKVAKKLNEFRPEDLGKLNICIQVNPDKDLNKSGIVLEETEEFISELRGYKMLRVRGLMAIPKETKNQLQQRKVFAKIRNQFEELKVTFPGLDTLSMGMSRDFKAAILEGATMIRIGTLIFGERK